MSPQRKSSRNRKCNPLASIGAGKEAVEEVSQELVSIANERRFSEGYTDGGVPELLVYWLNEMT